MKKRILFVDDEVEVLNGLKRMLRGMRHEWELRFATSGREALELFDKGGVFDVVVSDMRMPGMDGAQLLAEVQKRWPGAVRIVLSGHSERDMVMKSVGRAHQYLAKPCQPDVLKATVERACALRSLLASELLLEVVTRLDKLPSLPSLYFQIVEELSSPDSSLAKVGEIISKDAGMTAKILQLVNSAFFGFFTNIASPAQAVTLLGIDTVKALVMSVHVFGKLDKTIMGKVSMEQVWKHSFATGVATRELTRLEINDPKSAEKSFMAGILHDVGLTILASNMGERYSDVITLAEQENIELREAEKSVFGATHAEVGGYLLGLWGLPDDIVSAVFFHHTPAKSQETGFGATCAVNTANAIVSAKLPALNFGKAPAIDMEHVERIGKKDRITLWEKHCDEILNRVEEDERENIAGG